jgi:uncharacterized Zn-finger protein
MPFISEEAVILQQTTHLTTDPRNIPQLVDGAAWGGHRRPLTSPSIENISDTIAYNASIPRSATSSNRQQQRRTGARLRDPALPFQCQQCQNTFATEGNLRRHERNHVPARRYRCTEVECDRSFYFPKDLRRHMHTHNRLPPITCHVCGKFFDGSRLDNFSRHMEQNHPGVSVPKLDTIMAEQAAS